MKMRVLLKAGEILLGSTVTKRTGEQEFTLRDSITIYTEPKQVIKALAYARFLVSSKGDISVVAMETELLWVASDHELLEFLEGKPK
jgi:hypothetical protein